MNKQSPAVSICVSVYNGEKYLVDFLESAVTQTLENIEINCVDNWSTDATSDILHDYEKRYPGKVRCFRTDHHFPTAGGGRNVALSHARGEYVYFCDADDLITPQAMEKMYECAVKYDSDMVCGWAYRVFLDENDQLILSQKMSYKKSQPATNEMAIQSGCEFWVRLLRKNFVVSLGKIPENLVFDDVSYISVANSYARNIRFLDFPVYCYFRRNSSASGTARWDVCYTSVLAEKYALENCNPAYRACIEPFVAGRTCANLSNRWQFYDLFLNWAKEQMEWAPRNSMISGNSRLYNRLQKASELSQKETIPKRIIVNGFAGEISEDRIAELSQKAFYEAGELVILDKDSCDIQENPYVYRAYERGDYEFAGGYFALKEIYKNGGIFIHDRVKILNYFYYCTYQNSFFALQDKENYTDTLFGSPAGREVYADLLRTYSENWDKKLEYPSLAERIKTVLTAKYDIPLDGRPRLFQPEISVLSPDLCMVDTRFGSQTKRVICEADFSDHAGGPEYVTLRRSTLELLLSTPRGTAAETAKAKEWDKFTQSHVYKFVLLWKKAGDSKYGPILKGIFQKLLWLRQKIRTALRK